MTTDSSQTIKSVKAKLLRFTTKNKLTIKRLDTVAKVLVTKGYLNGDGDLCFDITQYKDFRGVVPLSCKATEMRDLLMNIGFVVSESDEGKSSWTVKATQTLLDYRDKYHDERKGNKTSQTAINNDLAILKKQNSQLMDRLDGVEQREKQTEAQLNDLWQAIRHIETHDKPVTQEKIERHLKLAKG